MIELVTVLVAACAIGFWLWAVLDLAARGVDDVPARGRWIAIVVLGGPIGAGAYLLVCRPTLDALPPVDHVPATVEARARD